MIVLTQGESYPITVAVDQDGTHLTPDMIRDMKICIGNLSKTYLSGGVKFDAVAGCWYVTPSPEETLAMETGKNSICIHVTYLDGTVIIDKPGDIVVEECCCKGVC